MPDPLFASRSPRLGLPLLFAAQAQKELFVNESLARLDGLVHCLVEDIAQTPPAAPADGECWLIGTTPSGDWAGRADHLAMAQAGQWLFQPPLPGMRVFNRAAGHDLRYRDGWSAAARPAAATGGATVDAEARATLAALIDSLVAAGILAPG